MSVSKTDICNMALTHISAKNRIANIETDTSTEAKILKVYYAAALEYVLADFDWGFARARVALAELDEDPPVDWSYIYTYPSDCIKARQIYDVNRRLGTVKIPYELGLNEDRTIKVILTDQTEALLLYTTSITDPNLFSPAYVIELSWYLAFLIAFPLTKKKTVRDMAKEGYVEFMGEAGVSEAEEEEQDELPESEFIRGRD